MVTEELRVIVQNIFLEWSPDSSLAVKIGDFGVSKHIPKDSTTVLQTQVGSGGYTAPEILIGGEYTYVVDCWSVGCIAYRLLTGTALFRTERDVIIYELTREPRPSTLLSCSPLGKSLIDALVDPMPLHRLSASAALSHRWCDLPSPILGHPRSSTLTSKLYAACLDQPFNLKLHETSKPDSCLQAGMDIDKDIPTPDLTPPSALPAESRERAPQESLW